jgi:hypothetical protein
MICSTALQKFPPEYPIARFYDSEFLRKSTGFQADRGSVEGDCRLRHQGAGFLVKDHNI